MNKKLCPIIARTKRPGGRIQGSSIQVRKSRHIYSIKPKAHPCCKRYIYKLSKVYIRKLYKYKAMLRKSIIHKKPRHIYKCCPCCYIHIKPCYMLYVKNQSKARR